MYWSKFIATDIQKVFNFLLLEILEEWNYFYCNERGKWNINIEWELIIIPSHTVSLVALVV